MQMHINSLAESLNITHAFENRHVQTFKKNITDISYGMHTLPKLKHSLKFIF